MPNTTMTPQSQPMTQAGLIELRTLIDKAKAGDRTALPRLREYLDINPNLWQLQGNIGVQAQAAWVKLIAGSNLYLQEVTVRKINAMKREYVGKNPTPMESLLVERIIMAWLQLAYVEACEAQHPETNIRWAEFQLKRQAQAEKQLRSAIDALNNLRKSQKTITVEVRQAETTPTTRPVMPEAYGGEISTYTGPTNRIKDLIPGPTTKPINGSNGKMNGHARFSDLEPTTIK